MTELVQNKSFFYQEGRYFLWFCFFFGQFLLWKYSEY